MTTVVTDQTVATHPYSNSGVKNWLVGTGLVHDLVPECSRLLHGHARNRWHGVTLFRMDVDGSGPEDRLSNRRLVAKMSLAGQGVADERDRPRVLDRGRTAVAE